MYLSSPNTFAERMNPHAIAVQNATRWLQDVFFTCLITCLLVSFSYAQKQVAITIDDLPFTGAGSRVNLKEIIDLNEKLLETAEKEQVPIIGFVNEKRVLIEGEMEARTNILRSWLAHGASLGNHTFSHPSFFKTPLQDFQREVIKGEVITQMLLEGEGEEMRYFRHPFLNTGPTLEVKAAFEQFLSDHGYEIAPVTIESADYVFNLIYSRAKDRGDTETMAYAADQYILHTGKMIDFFEEVTTKTIGRPIPQIYLCHDNELHADHFIRLIHLFQEKGYEFISLEEAMKDEVYRMEDVYVGRMGISWLHRWNKKNWMEYFRQEPEPAQRIFELYKQKD
ncbi:MAG: polysaccharide deacetylase family protein [Bacteroidota bacterium]